MLLYTTDLKSARKCHVYINRKYIRLHSSDWNFAWLKKNRLKFKLDNNKWAKKIYYDKAIPTEFFFFFLFFYKFIFFLDFAFLSAEYDKFK